MADDLSISVSLRSFAADADDRDECTREDRDMLRAAADAIERLRAERDEARREVCMIMGGKGGRSSCISPDAVDYANSRGWDCFKENTDN